MRVGIDRGDLGLVNGEHGIAIDEATIVVESVDVSIEAGDDQLELPVVVAIEIGEHRGGDDAALGPVANPLAFVDEGRQRLTRVVGVGGRLEDALAIGVPAIDPALEIGGVDLLDAVAVHVADRDRGEDRTTHIGGDMAPRVSTARAVVGDDRRPVAAHGPAIELTDHPALGVVVEGMNEAIAGPEDQLVAIVPVEVGQRRRGGTVGGQLQW